ncbi:MAG: NERD domain-containing protein [Gammaproteobacteria bacterium]|nr:hypothetical protein [Gammaproteobacteria bacterium]
MSNMPVEIPAWSYPVVGGVAIAALGAWGYVLVRRYRERKETETTLASVAYEMLKNVLIPNGNDGYIHVHYLLLTQRGLLVADLLDMPGAIFGGDQMIEWTVIGKKHRYTFPNPQHTLYDRMAAVRLLTDDVPVEGRIIFTQKSEFPKGKPRHVLRIDELTSEFPPVDRVRGNITAAFAEVWANVKKNAEPNPLAA